MGLHVHIKRKRVAVNGNGILVKLHVTQDPKFADNAAKPVRVAHGL
jgi:hypothetical protein